MTGPTSKTKTEAIRQALAAKKMMEMEVVERRKEEALSSRKPCIHHACGHRRTVDAIEKSLCPECKKSANAKRHRVWLKGKSTKGRDSRQVQRGRLPEGSQYELKFHNGKWTGTLVVAGTRYHGEAVGVFRLMEKLDTMWRESHAQPT